MESMVNIPALRGRVAAVVLLFGLMSAPACAGEVRAAVSADFAAVMERIAPLFRAQTGHAVTVTSGAGGKLYAQIRGGGEFDVFLSADEEMPKTLMQDGLAVVGSRFVYATGRLALWSVQPGLVDDQGKVLTRGGFDRLAIANPRYSPYGVAAKETLTRLTIWNAIQRKLDKGEDVTETWRLAATERVDLALVALSQVMRDGKVADGSWWLVPASMHGPIRQSAVLLTGAQDQEASKAFLAFLKSEQARAAMRGFGYESP
jgi:molybdate transport system substrate-binding protein